MSQFQCRAKDDKGKLVKKRVQAADYADAYMMIQSLGLQPVQVTEIKEANTAKRVKKMSLRNVTVFCRQLGTMLTSGIPLVKAFDILKEQAKKSKEHELNRVYENIYQNIQMGLSLYESMEAQGDTFPPMLVNMVQAGEISGNLDVVVEKIAVYYDKQSQLKRKIDSTLMYPKILIFMIVGIVLALFTWVLPQFFEVFTTMNLQLPMMTQIIVKISDFIINKWYVLVFIVVSVLTLYSIAMTNERFAYQMDYLKTRIPYLGMVEQKTTIANFTSTMGVLYSSGISMLQALEISTNVLNNRYYKDRLTIVKMEVEQGKMLSVSLDEANIFEPMVTSLLLVGEEAGNLEQIFEMTSDFYGAEAEEAVSKLVAIMEPAVIIVIGVLVLAIVGSVIFPLFSMATQVSEQTVV
ncbi:MAG: type II secretion system F family protein [Lachnospiraceae bacterium]